MKRVLPFLLIQPEKLKFAWYKALIACAFVVFVFNKRKHFVKGF
jgi:hypothetical protein